MNKYLLTFFFLLLLGCQACRNNVQEETFLEVDTTAQNQQIRRAILNNERWAEEPLTIINKFYRPEYLEAINTTYTGSLVKDSKDHYTATVLQEGLKDFPAFGIKFIVELKWNYPGFLIQRIKRAYKCNKGFGSLVYSKDSCQ